VSALRIAFALLAACRLPFSPVVIDSRPQDAATADADAAQHDAPGVDAEPAQWALVQTAASVQPAATLAATQNGSLIVVAVQTFDGGPIASVTDDASNVYARIPGSRADASGGLLNVELWYVAGAKPATTIVAAASQILTVVVWEVSGIRTTGALDATASLSDGAPTTAPTGAQITTGAAGDFVVSIAIVENQVAGASTGFVEDHETNGNGWAHLADPAAPAGRYVARWDQPTIGSYCASAAAFLRR
jgi:hypothetical protein